jgi:carboxyl-terminal processing protease
LGCQRLPEQAAPAAVQQELPAEHSRAEPNEPASLPAPTAGAPKPQIEEICAAIYKGDFAEAHKLLGGSEKSKNADITRLAEIISEYEAIEQKRKSAREAAYREQLAELGKLQADDVNGVNDINDVNDVNDISKTLSVIAKVGEFADETQKAQLLSEPFVQETFQRAVDKAGELESKGEWLDAYAVCYSWLQAIDDANQTYSTHAEELIEKAEIAASFQDSPCESSRERYEGVKKEIFERSLDALRFNYVNSIIDYRQMAIEAVERCQLLGEVVNTSSAEGLSLGELGGSVDRSRFSVWSEGLEAILHETKESPMEVSKDSFIEIFEKVLALNAESLGLSDQILITQFAEVSLFALDPYTVIVWPKQVEDFEKLMTNEFTGIGVEISKEKGLLTVMSLLPGTPAYNSGLDAGDVIEKVDGVETKDMSLACAVKNITGPAETKVTLTIKRPSDGETRDITITRARITVPTVRGWQRTETGKWIYMIDENRKIGYVRITSFSEKTDSDLEEVLNGLEAEGLRGLILDLRFNSGGLLSAAIEVADAFLEGGPIVITRPRSWVSSTYAWAHREGTHPNYPLVILINSFSASASEIVAGALADPLHKRATLVGERTHGKGSVQGIISYPRGGAQLKYTMAYYYLPSGQRVKSRETAKKEGGKDWGVGPDIEVKLRSDELRNMFDVQRDNDVLVRAGHDNEAMPLKKHTAEESLSADAQLAVGVLVIRSKLIQTSSEI